ncbi:MAG: peptide deformylase [Caldisericia bacterium]|nr:peptide deformylase [Caldisericia bacterium]
MLHVITYGHPVLRKKAKSIAKMDAKIEKMIGDMVYTMRNNRIKGCGLAAPQVGVSLRIAVVEPSENQLIYLINPEILSKKGSHFDTEGCLSIPGVYGSVERSTEIQYSSLNIHTGKKELFQANGFTARIIQHEMDHLNGVLFTDYIPNLDSLEFIKGERIPPKLLQKYSDQKQ